MSVIEQIGPASSKRDSRREAILDVAQDVFLAEGYAAASMSTIAAKLGVPCKLVPFKTPGELGDAVRGMMTTLIMSGDEQIKKELDTVATQMAAHEKTMAELEPLYAATAGRETLTIKVSSNGCTTKVDFAFFVERKDGATTVAFARKRLDRCRTIQAGHADLEFTMAELGIAPDTPVFVLNPFSGL